MTYGNPANVFVCFNAKCQVDDLIRSFSMIDVSRTSPGSPRLALTQCSFGRVLMTMQRLLTGDCSDFTHDGSAHVPWDTSMGSFTVAEYSGPADSYGVIGIPRKGRYNNSSVSFKSPFALQHVYSCVLVNVRALNTRGIQYPPWPFFEVWHWQPLSWTC